MSYELSTTPERSLEAQVAILGAVLIDDRCVGKVVTQMVESQFSGVYRTIFRAVEKLYRDNSVVDPVTVNNALGSGYGETLMQLMDTTPTTANIDEYIRIAVEQAKLDDYKTLAAELKECETSEDAQDVMDRLNKITRQNARFEVVNAADGYGQALDRLGKPADHFNWLFPKISDIITSRLGDYVCIGARPSVGKTALTLQIAFEQAKTYRVGYFSFETSTAEIYDRLLSLAAEVDSVRVRRKTISEREQERIFAAADAFLAEKLDVIDASGMTVTDIKNMALENRYEIIYIDYLQIVQPERWASQDTRANVVSQISLGFKNIARQLNILVVVNSQLRRTPGKTDFDPPTMSDLRESGQIEQDADAIMLLYKHKCDWAVPPRDIFIAKNKKGPAGGVLTFAFEAATQKFREIDGEKLDDCTPKCVTHRENGKPAGMAGQENLPF